MSGRRGDSISRRRDRLSCADFQLTAMPCVDCAFRAVEGVCLQQRELRSKELCRTGEKLRGQVSAVFENQSYVPDSRAFCGALWITTHLDFDEMPECDFEPPLRARIQGNLRRRGYGELPFLRRLCQL
jgi:hypothetical protein